MKIKNLFLLAPIILLSFTAVCQEAPKTNSIEGRWDLTIEFAGQTMPGWLEIRHSGINTLVGRVMLMFGSARPISKINYNNGKFDFSIPPQWDRGNTDFIIIEGTLSAGSLKGIMKYVDNKTYNWIGTKAPSLPYIKNPKWDKRVKLFNGKDLQGWHATGENQWLVESGVLKSKKSGSNLISDPLFTDFKLHIEFRYPKGGNSGIYLRGRYEVQLADSKGMEPQDDQFGGIYGLLAPNEMVAKNPGEWQSMDITLIGNRVTVVANGVPIIADQVIPGITGGALDSKEGEPGPIMLQGDHSPVEYRNIIITPIKL